jgi:hypothetical protein
MKKENPPGVSQNVAWTFQKGSWMAHIMVTIIAKLVYSTFFSSSTSWQLTILTYNISTFIFFHWIIGDPFDHTFYGCTFWEQMTEQLENTYSMLFLWIYPIILFIVGAHMIKANTIMFYLCVFSLCLVVIPKMGFMHKKRLFGLRDKK